MATVVQKIAEWAADLTLDDVPQVAVDAAVRSLVDVIAVSIPGAATPVGIRARTVATAIFGTGHSVVFGGDRRLRSPGAALANGAAAHALDFDDNCYAGVVHGSAVVAPAALAVAQEVEASGREMLTGFIAGLEAEFAIGAAATLSIYERGLFTSALLGAGGAAVAASKALRLDAKTMANALGLAVSGAGGLKACLGTDAKPLLLGQAAQAGVIAALLAQAGATAPNDVFEHPRGFTNLFGQGVFEVARIEKLGVHWCLIDPGIDFKAAPVCLSAAAALDGMLEIMSEHQIREADVDRVSCELSPISVANLTYDRPRSIAEAQFSLPFVIACALKFGKLSLAQLDDSLLRSPEFQATMSRVELLPSQPFRSDPYRTTSSDRYLITEYPESAFLVVYCKDGRRIERFSGAARGTAALPLSDHDLDQKFLGCTDGLLCASRAKSILTRLRSLQQLASVRHLI
jgi:2-methylcitrate dehydratase PrpD